MGILDKLKGAVKAVTGGAAKVTLEFEPATVPPGGYLRVRVTAESTGGEIKSKGIYIDLNATENVKLPKGTIQNQSNDIHASKQSFAQEFQIAPAFTLAAKETKQFEGQVQIPNDVQPSFNGNFTTHSWKIQGRVEATGNDPDSGWMDLRVSR